MYPRRKHWENAGIAQTHTCRRWGECQHHTSRVERNGRRKDAKRQYMPASSRVLQIIRDAMIPRMQQNALRPPNRQGALPRDNASAIRRRQFKLRASGRDPGLIQFEPRLSLISTVATILHNMLFKLANWFEL
jgi:hypothetical protein